MTDILLLLVYAGVLVCAIWLFFNRTDYRRWFYIAYSLAFASLMVGIWPGLEGSTVLGFTLLLTTVGLQIVTNVLFESHDKHGIDIRTGKLLKH